MNNFQRYLKYKNKYRNYRKNDNMESEKIFEMLKFIKTMKTPLTKLIIKDVYLAIKNEDFPEFRHQLEDELYMKFINDIASNNISNPRELALAIKKVIDLNTHKWYA